MNKVAMYLDKQEKIILEDREKTLIALGLTQKDYSPDGKETWQYPKYDYVDGNKKYYREVAIAVTDEEYALILSKTKQVEEIKAKEDLERQKEKNRASSKAIKKWIPIFEKPKSDWSSKNEEKVDTGRSNIAFILRIAAWIMGTIAIALGIIITFEAGTFLPILITLGVGTIEILMFYALAAVLDYLAELTSMIRGGHKYVETNK